MNLKDLKIKALEIDKDKYGKIYSFIDFGNVNYWYEKDEKDETNNLLPEGYKLAVDIEKLANFLDLFSNQTRFYYGMDDKNRKSIHMIKKSRNNFDSTITKPIQRIKHYLEGKELKSNTRALNYDLDGSYVYIPKCNFDVEICIDSIKLVDKYDTFCLLSSDADFASLLYFLKEKRKKIILIKGGFAQHNLIKYADLVINAQDIKKDIVFQKQKSRL